MIKTPLSTVIGGAFWTPSCTVIGGASKTLNQIIKSLFANNEQGFFYDPNDLSTMFQNAAGTVPVTGVGQAVGLVLDKSGRNNHAYQTVSASRPILRQTPILGSELVVNGDFSSGTAGAAAKNNVTLAVTDGVLKVTNNDTYYGYAEMSFNTEVGKKYLLRADVIASSGSGASFHVASISNGNDILNNVAAETMAKGVVITAKTTPTYISLKVPTNVVGSWRTFDNVSAKELQGYYTDKNYVEYDKIDDKLTTTLPAQLIGCTVVRAVPNVGTQVLTNRTIPTTYNDNTDHCGLIVINRDLTATETSQITKLFNKAAGV